MGAYRRIATEEAFATPDVLKHTRLLIESGRVEPGLLKMGETILGDSLGALAVQARLQDVGAGRLAQMDADGVDVALLSLTSPGVQIFDAQLATSLATDANDVLAQAVHDNPTRFAGLAAIAPQAPEAAARELERAKALKLNGFIVNSHTGGEYLDAAKFRPIFEAAQALDMPMYLHPREPSPTMVGPYLDYGLYFAGWGFSAECGLHAMRLIMSGLFEQYARMRVVLGHMGEGIPYWLQRIDNRYALQVKLGAVEPLEQPPSFYFLRNFVITTAGVTSMPALRHVLDVLGADRIMFAADYPYEDAAAGVRFIETADIGEEDRRAIFAGTAERVFGLAPVAAAHVDGRVV